MLTRRDLLVISGAALQTGIFGRQSGTKTPWHQNMRRCGQVNFNERDPQVLNIAEWVDYWSSLKLDALLLNAGGIMAFYPTKLPYHHRSEFLGTHDLFGDFTKAAKQKGMRVVARLDCNYAYEEAWKAHPEWFEKTSKGDPVKHAESPWLYKTCMYSGYFTEQMPAIIREINSLYDVDGFFTNGWPSTGRAAPCRCDSCLALGEPGSPEFAEAHLNRVLDVWKLWDTTAKQKKWDSVYVGNLGGSIRAVTDLRKISEVAGWFNADHQGRSGNTPIWDCALQGRVALSVMKGRTVTNVTGSYANARPLWRHSAKAPLETTMWMAQTTASGMVPWFHWLGGAPEDLRWKATGQKFFQWIAKYEPHFVNRHSVANVGVVFSQRMNALYTPPGGTDTTEFLQGLYYALLESRIPFDFVHEDDLGPETVKKYAALVLPNTALMSNAQCEQIQAFAAQGGSVLATFETSLYDERGKARSDFGLGKLFGMNRSGNIQGPNGNSYYARIMRQHDLVRGFTNTALLPGAEYRIPVKSPGNPVLTVMPPFPAFPPEMVYSRNEHTDEPAAVVLENGRSRLVYLPGDVDRSYWRSGNPDLSLLLRNAIGWMVQDRAPVSVKGAGMLEIFAWETQPGFAVHFLNYTNPNMLRGWMTQAYPVGPQKVRMELPAGTKVARVQLLRAESGIAHTQTGNVVEFTIPRVVDYEIAAVVRA
jgi:hypothetical protein